jgi:hypothetical protein
MTAAIIDTNVVVIANGQTPDVVSSCAENCRHLIAEMAERRLIIDAEGEVFKEYLGAIQRDRPYGLGARFVIDLINRQFDDMRCLRIELVRNATGRYLDFPDDPRLQNFDASDMKFAALSRRSEMPVSTATDSDWVNFRGPLEENGVTVDFLCGSDAGAWFK